MRRHHLAAGLLLASACAHAEVVDVQVPGKTWGIRFDMPSLAEYQGSVDGARFQYKARSPGRAGEPQTLLTLFLEPDASGSNKACFDAYWAKSRKDPLIDAASVRISSTKRLEQVVYRYTFGQPSANFYLVHEGYCIDVHVSIERDVPDTGKRLAAIGDSLQITSGD